MTTATASRAGNLDPARLQRFVEEAWEQRIVPSLSDYIRIPAKSPMFDAAWEKNGHLERAARHVEAWARQRAIEGLQVEIVRLPGRTPVVLMDVPGSSGDTILLYGHYDKQPEMVGWLEGLGPWTPVRKGDHLYGRGAGDDGYAAYSALTAIEALQAQGVPHARCVVLIEGCEESGSFDLPYYVDALAARLGTPALVVTLDSGAGNYDQLWCTTSLRGIVGGALEVTILDEGVHSGAASGIVPSSFRILRQILSRLEDERTGEIRDRVFHVEVPADRMAEVKRVSAVLGDKIAAYPLVKGARALSSDPVELNLNNTWRPALSITGADGFPSITDAGNVLRPRTAVKVSLRLPPTTDAEKASAHLKQLLEADPPYGARVTFTPDHPGSGWNAPSMAPWLSASLEAASAQYFGQPPAHTGIGGSIPFMAMLGERFPQAQFLITGVMGPNSNAHGPNEFIHLPTGSRVTACVAQVLADQYRAARG